METTLVLTGITLFLVCTLLFLRHAFANTLGWGLTGLLLPPSALLFYTAHWKNHKRLALVHLVSVLWLLLTAAMWIRAHPYALDGSRLSWLRDQWAPAFAERPLVIGQERFVTERELQPYLHGRTHPGGIMRGEAVDFVRTTLVNGVLRFKSDEDVFSRLEVSIPLEHVTLSPGENLLEFTPESPDSPSVHLTYYPDGGRVPEVEIFSHRFWMELLISVKEGPVYTGYIKMRLPDQQRSFMAGEFRAYTRDLRFEGDEVDRFFDTNATIEYVAEQYLVNRLGNLLEQVTDFQDTFYQTVLENPTGRTEARLRLNDGSEHVIRISLLKGSEGWVVDSGPTAELINALRTLRNSPPSAIRTLPARERLQQVDPAAVADLLGRAVVIFTRDGKQRTGIVSEVDQHNVTLESSLGGGTVGMLVKRSDIAEVTLDD